MPNDLTQLGLRYQGDGSFLTTGPYWTVQCDRAFAVGEVIHFQRWEDRSATSHAHFFASIAEAWLNLPDNMAERFPSSEALRKFCLIKAGHCDSDTFVAASKAEALRLASFIRAGEEYAVVTVEGTTVHRFKARSQSMRAQGKEDFQRVKDRVLQILSEILGTEVGSLEKRGTEAA